MSEEINSSGVVSKPTISSKEEQGQIEKKSIRSHFILNAHVTTREELENARNEQDKKRESKNNKIDI